MINLESKNIFLYSNKNYRGQTALSKYLDFLELGGKNFIYMQNNRTQTSKSLHGVKKIYYTNDSLLSIIEYNSFRLDFILIETDSIPWTLNELKDVKIPIVYIKQTETPEKYSGWDLAYLFSADERKFTQQSLSSYSLINKVEDNSDLHLTDLNTGDKSSIADVIVRAKRNAIISDIINPK